MPQQHHCWEFKGITKKQHGSVNHALSKGLAILKILLQKSTQPFSNAWAGTMVWCWGVLAGRTACWFSTIPLCSTARFISSSVKPATKLLGHYNFYLAIYVLKSSLCCDQKSWAACAQSFALWQQATIEITRRDHSIIACSRHIYIVFFFTHIPFVVNQTFNAMPPERLQQHPLLFTMNRTNHAFFVWRLNSARPPHPGHSTTLLWS